MTLKEQLAHEAQLKWNWYLSNRRELPKPTNEYEHGFLAGFEKAREMAAEICDCATHEACGESKATLQIRELGEEECPKK